MENTMVEFAIEGRAGSVAMESLKRARQKAGITKIKKADSRSNKPVKPVSAEKLKSDLRVLLARTETNIKEHTKRAKEIEAEIEKMSRDFGFYSMHARMKRQELREEQKKIATLERIRADCRKQLGI